MARSKKAGDAGEARVRDMLFAQGYDVIYALETSKRHGTDIVAFRGENGEGGILVGECKNRTTPKSRNDLSRLQKRVGGMDHFMTHLTGMMTRFRSHGDYTLRKYTRNHPMVEIGVDNAGFQHFAACIESARGGLTQQEITQMVEAASADRLTAPASQMPERTGRITCKVFIVNMDNTIDERDWPPAGSG